MKVVVFAYDFPHQRSVDFILRLALSSWRPQLVVGAPWRQVNIKTSRVPIRRDPVKPLHPRDVCALAGISYVSHPHDETAIPLVRGYDFGVVAGARILPPKLTRALPILNMHPGLIPENRGLDNIVYAVRKDIPMGVTAHLIDGRVDAGTVLARWEVPVYATDCLIDAGSRVFDGLSAHLLEAVERIDLPAQFLDLVSHALEDSARRGRR